MKFKEANKLICEMMQQLCGGQTQSVWLGFREILEGAVKKYKTAQDFMNDLNSRSDICDDDRWELECYESAIELLFALCKSPSEGSGE